MSAFGEICQAAQSSSVGDAAAVVVDSQDDDSIGDCGADLNKMGVGVLDGGVEDKPAETSETVSSRRSRARVRLPRSPAPSANTTVLMSFIAASMTSTCASIAAEVAAATVADTACSDSPAPKRRWMT